MTMYCVEKQTKETANNLPGSIPFKDNMDKIIYLFIMFDTVSVWYL